VLSIANHVTTPFEKVCGKCHVVDIMIYPTGGVHYNTCFSKSMVQKLHFLHGSIATNDEHVLLIIECK
jgi:hypothetical protein